MLGKEKVLQSHRLGVAVISLGLASLCDVGPDLLRLSFPVCQMQLVEIPT